MPKLSIYRPPSPKTPAIWRRIAVTAAIATPVLYGVIRGYLWSIPRVVELLGGP